ncbi:hypothetical protein JMJ77_0002037 [Colletotrichum scovillei]|uniref:Uncharacterized protein n=1 Tax=Colletotrichum scovillei TaxID=1209932 RepID=A0A9P7R8V9_9PEZI|nr:hypothetical protein JMJ77_0002037 [Colletotrichum scovillei]KAG7070450.1 hypothetical protein JMJ76_0001703 [Colletotrichum scovillei]KAG7078725.1 hypothetical protein JMJ78_0002393 [Colletotrichum scovillei]
MVRCVRPSGKQASWQADAMGAHPSLHSRARSPGKRLPWQQSGTAFGTGSQSPCTRRRRAGYRG